ncbi:MAG: SIS domain-containing protein [Gammaproteobacteria bacterium]|nr:SIS domain-containing protein [Gammaproteobacteria bacterium]
MVFPTKKDLDISSFISGYSSNIAKGYDSIDIDELRSIVSVLEENITNKHKIFTCGNGGSSAIAEHFTCDFVKGSSTETDIQPIVFSLPSNTSLITAIANDISYDDIFSLQVEKYASKDDILLAISCSGNSPNIISALELAKSKGMSTISFLGFDGGKALELSEYCIHINIHNYGIVEDIHQSLMHMLAQYLRLKHIDPSANIDEKIF